MEPRDDPPTHLLIAAAEGDREAADRLLPLIYDQLRRAAQRHLAGERIGHTLQATALVHDVFLRLAGPREVPWRSRAHFYAAAAQAMRRVLIDHARSRKRRVRPLPLAECGDVGALFSADSEQILAVEDALQRLESEDPQAAAVVRLRFFAGLSVEQVAETLELSSRSVARLWKFARARLFAALREP